MNDDVSRSVAYGSAGAAAAIAVGGLLVPVRDVIGSTNAALVLVVVIVSAGALGGRLTGAMTAAAACLSFNFFHTQPHYTLRVHSDNDIWTIALLFVIGLAVGEVAVFARSNRTSAIVERAGLAHLEAISAMVADDRPISAVWPAVRAALLDELRLVDASVMAEGRPSISAGSPSPWPTCSRSRSTATRPTFDGSSFSRRAAPCRSRSRSSASPWRRRSAPVAVRP